MKVVYLLFVPLFLILSCRKKEVKEDPIPEPAPIPAATSGPIKGKLSHFNQFGLSYTTALNNATVSLEGSNIQALTDELGNYTLSNVSAGTQTLVFNKPGCGLIKIESFIYKIGDTISYNAAVADLPTYTLDAAVVKDTTWFSSKIPGIYYRATSTNSNTNASAIAIISKDNKGSLSDVNSYLNYAPVSNIGLNADYNRFISYVFLKDNYQIVSGDVIYFKIYPVASEASFYIDAKLSRPRYTAFGTPLAQTFSIAIP